MSHNRQAQTLCGCPRPLLLFLHVTTCDRNFVDGKIGVAYITERRDGDDCRRVRLVIARGLDLEGSWISLDQVIEPVLTAVDLCFLFALEEGTLLARIPGLEGDRSATCQGD